MSTTKTLFTGRKELTMAEYEALETLDPNKDYNITDYPKTSITNTQMTFALTCARLFPKNSTFVCLDDGTYSAGKMYKIKVTDGVKSWEEIESGGGSGGATAVIIELTTAETTSGTLTDDQYNTLTADDSNYIETTYDGHSEKYYLNTEASEDGYRIYAHTEIENGSAKIKAFTITESVKSWNITEPSVGGAKKYQHNIVIHNNGNYIYFSAISTTSTEFSTVGDILGLAEIPTQSYFTASGGTESSPFNIVRWIRKYDDTRLQYEYINITNQSRLTDVILDTVTVEQDTVIPL